MNDDWTQEDQDRVVAARREIAAEYQAARKNGPAWAVWLYDKLASVVLWVEREGQRLRRGW